MAKYALVIGINEYEQDDFINGLRYAEHDARKVASIFEDLGYRVSCHITQDATYDRIRERLSKINGLLTTGDTFLFYFSGHGCVAVDSRQYLLPYDADIWAVKKGGAGALPLDFVLNASNVNGVEQVLIIDACRNDVLRGKGQESSIDQISEKAIQGAIERGGQNNTLQSICLSCSPGQHSYELNDLKASIFSAALVETLNIHIERGWSFSLFGAASYLNICINANVDRFVSAEFSEKQVPWMIGSLVELFDKETAAFAQKRRQEADDQNEEESAGSENVKRHWKHRTKFHYAVWDILASSRSIIRDIFRLLNWATKWLWPWSKNATARFFFSALYIFAVKHFISKIPSAFNLDLDWGRLRFNVALMLGICTSMLIYKLFNRGISIRKILSCGLLVTSFHLGYAPGHTDWIFDYLDQKVYVEPLNSGHVKDHMLRNHNDLWSLYARVKELNRAARKGASHLSTGGVYPESREGQNEHVNELREDAKDMASAQATIMKLMVEIYDSDRSEDTIKRLRRNQAANIAYIQRVCKSVESHLRKSEDW